MHFRNVASVAVGSARPSDAAHNERAADSGEASDRVRGCTPRECPEQALCPHGQIKA